MYFFRRSSFNYLALLAALTLTSCAPPPAGGQSQMGPADFIINTVMFFLLGLFIYYMLVLKPQQDAEQQKKKVESLKRNDKVITSGGILGKVSSISGEIITVEIAPNTKIQVKSSHVFPDPSMESEKKDQLKKKKEE